jgi:hypothetical protein
MAKKGPTDPTRKWLKVAHKIAAEDMLLKDDALNAHKVMVYSARHVVQDLEEADKENLTAAVLNIFEQWKDECGKAIWPNPLGATPDLSELYFPVNEGKTSAAKRQKAMQHLNAWQCHPHADTPVTLFNALSIYYAPMFEYIALEGRNKTNIRAPLILYSDKEQILESSVDTTLTDRASTLNLLRKLESSEKNNVNRIGGRKKNAAAKRSETTKRVLAAYKKCIDDNEPKSLDSIVEMYTKTHGMKTNKKGESRPGISTSYVQILLAENGIRIPRTKKSLLTESENCPR